MTRKTPRSKIGCFVTGCLGSIALLIVGVVLVYFGVRYAVKVALDTYTDDKPTVFAESNMSSEDVQSLENRYDEFRKSVDQGLPAEPLELDTEEVNHLIETDPAFNKLKDKFRVQITQDKIRGTISIPADMAIEVFPDIPNIEMLRGRYFNATVDLRLVLRNEELAVYLEDLSVKGKQIPSDVLTRLKNRDLIKDDRISGQLKRQFGQLRNITVKNGKIIMVGSKGTLEEWRNRRN